MTNAAVIVVAKALDAEPAPPKVRGDLPEYRFAFRWNACSKDN